MKTNTVLFFIIFLFTSLLYSQESGLSLYTPGASILKDPVQEILTLYGENSIPLAFAKISIYDKSNQIASGYSAKDGTFPLFIHDLSLYTRSITVKAEAGSSSRTATAALLKPEDRIIRFTDFPAAVVKNSVHYCFIIENGASFSGYSLRLTHQLSRLFSEAKGMKSWSLIFSSDGKYLFYDRSVDSVSLTAGLQRAFSSSSKVFDSAIALSVISDSIKTDDCTEKQIIYLTSGKPMLFIDPSSVATLEILRQRNFSLSLISPVPQKSDNRAAHWLSILRSQWMTLSSDENSHSLQFCLGLQKSDKTIGHNSFYWMNAASLFRDLAALEGYSLPSRFTLNSASTAETEEAFTLLSQSFRSLGYKMSLSTGHQPNSSLDSRLELSGITKNGILVLTLSLKLAATDKDVFTKDFTLPGL